MSIPVSVVIPLYNAESWIKQTLESVLNQTALHDLEVLVIDDGSRDDGASIARGFLAEHGLSGRVVSLERNGGLGAARNAGWKLASGEWIQFLDADDLLAPGKIELQLAAAEQVPDDVAVVYSNWQHLRRLDGEWRADGQVMQLAVDDDPPVQILQDFAFGFVGPTLIRKSALPSVSGFDERPNLGEDIDLMLRLAMTGAKFFRVQSDEATFLYRDTPNSLWRQSSVKVNAVWNLLQTFRRTEEFLRTRNGGLSAEARIALARRYALRLDVFNEQAPRLFHEVFAWIRDLELTTCPPDTRGGMRLVAGVVGYANALRLRSAVRLRVSRLRTALNRNSTGPSTGRNLPNDYAVRAQKDGVNKGT